MRILTVRNYALSDVASALQKSIRRGDERVAGYFAIEMFESGYAAYAWRRLLTVSAEDCAGCITTEIKALYDSWTVIVESKGKRAGRIFLSKAVVLLCQARKSRDADHLTNLVYDPKAIDEARLEHALGEARAQPEPIPDYAYDCHTSTGKKRGKTKLDFFLEEQDALFPREPGLFDDNLEALRRGERSMGGIETMIETTRETFANLQGTAQRASTSLRDYTIDLEVKYGSGGSMCWSRTESKKLESLRKRYSKSQDRFFRFLKILSPRSWDVGVPCHWIVTDLTYEDAVTRGALSVVPPPAYGYDIRHNQQFAWPLKG